jgi:hypothetical protein
MSREVMQTDDDDDIQYDEMQVKAVIKAAILKEREACAQIAKDWDASHPHTNYGACISNAIRARGNT